MIKREELGCIASHVQEYYKQLHMHPELGLMEYETSKFIREKLESFGIETIVSTARTGLVAIIEGCAGGTGERTIALRADMDALPIREETGLEYASKTDGAMHACGHDGHVSMLLGAAEYLAANRNLFSGTVKFIFQPAEEDNAPGVQPLGPTPGGAWYIIEDGHLEDVQACVAIHLNPMLKTGEVLIHQREAMASTDLFRIAILGQGGHGSAPEKAIDPIPALAELLTALNMLPAREFSPFEPLVVTVGTVHTPSSAWNIIPERAELSGTFRTYNEEVRRKVDVRIRELAEGIAGAHRCKAQYEREEGYFPTVNDEQLVRKLWNTAENLLGEGKVVKDGKPFTGGEDAGFYFAKVPGAMIFLGCSSAENPNPVDLHNPRFVVDLEALGHGVALHVNNVLDFLNEDKISC